MKTNCQLHQQVAASASTFIPQTGYVCIGLSGGVDSVVLLHLLKQIIQPGHLSAIHVHHGLSPNADAWAKFCKNLCSKLEIPLQIEYVQLNRAGGESLENLARMARHNIFLNSNAAIIALAHHQNDQVETILSQILRGSDLHNIAAMLQQSHKKNKTLWRPLLEVSRAQIEEYATLCNLEYITDESNADTKFLRNFVRHDLIPLLHARDNNIMQKLLNFNKQLQQLLTIADQTGKDDLQKCSDNQLNISLEIFREFNPERQLNILAQFILAKQAPLPTHKQLLEFTRQAISSAWDKMPKLNLNDSTYLTKYKNTIFLTAV